MRIILSKVMANFSVCFTIFVVFTALVMNSSYAIDLRDPSVVGAWPFNEGTGDTVEDASQYHNDGAVTDGEWVEGVFGKALKFNGASSYVEIPHTDSLDFSGKDKIRISCWINITGAGQNWGRIVDKSPVNHSYTMTKGGGDNNILWRVVTPGGRVDIRTSPLEQNKWYHIAATYDGKESQFYLDGKLDKKQAGAGELQPADMSLVIGGQTGELEGGGQGSWFDGMIDEVVILSKVLTEAEIKELMENGVVLAVETSEKLAITWGKIKK